MIVGDMVIRAYAYYAIIPGIIVATTKPDPQEYGPDQGVDFISEFVVQWSDGSHSTELYEELDLLFDKHIVAFINSEEEYCAQEI
jgi:hypothetical protein